MYNCRLYQWNIPSFHLKGWNTPYTNLPQTATIGTRVRGFLWSYCGKNWSSRENPPVQSGDNHLLYCQGSNMGWDVWVCDIYHRARWSTPGRCKIPPLLPRTLEVTLHVEIAYFFKQYYTKNYMRFLDSICIDCHANLWQHIKEKYTSLPSLSFLSRVSQESKHLFFTLKLFHQFGISSSLSLSIGWTFSWLKFCTELPDFTPCKTSKAKFASKLVNSRLKVCSNVPLLGSLPVSNSPHRFSSSCDQHILAFVLTLGGTE